MLRPPPRSPLFPTRRSSDLEQPAVHEHQRQDALDAAIAPGGEVDRLVAEGALEHAAPRPLVITRGDRKSTRLNSSHRCISYAVFCLKKKKKNTNEQQTTATV